MRPGFRRGSIKAFATEFDPQPFHLDEEAAPHGRQFSVDWRQAAGIRRLSPLNRVLPYSGEALGQIASECGRGGRDFP
jgi:hypothetical protein